MALVTKAVVFLCDRQLARLLNGMLFGAILTLVLVTAQGQTDLTPEKLRDTTLSELDPPYETYVDRDYSRLNDGDSQRQVDARDLPEGGITVTSIAECAVECTETPNCNAASWYGAAEGWTDVRNCWLKELQPGCQLPSDAETHTDKRTFIIARPRECNGVPSVGSPGPQPLALAPAAAPLEGDLTPPDSSSVERSSEETLKGPPARGISQGDSDETINTEEERRAVLGDRQMNEDVPTVSEIENGISSACQWSMAIGALLASAVAWAMLQ